MLSLFSCNFNPHKASIALIYRLSISPVIPTIPRMLTAWGIFCLLQYLSKALFLLRRVLISVKRQSNPRPAKAAPKEPRSPKKAGKTAKTGEGEVIRLFSLQNSADLLNYI